MMYFLKVFQWGDENVEILYIEQDLINVDIFEIEVEQSSVNIRFYEFMYWVKLCWMEVIYVLLFECGCLKGQYVGLC